MTGAQASYSKTLSEETGEPDAYADDLTKAEASRRIDVLKAENFSVLRGLRVECSGLV